MEEKEEVLIEVKDLAGNLLGTISLKDLANGIYVNTEGFSPVTCISILTRLYEGDTTFSSEEKDLLKKIIETSSFKLPVKDAACKFLQL